MINNYNSKSWKLVSSSLSVRRRMSTRCPGIPIAERKGSISESVNTGQWPWFLRNGSRTFLAAPDTRAEEIGASTDTTRNTGIRRIVFDRFVMTFRLSEVSSGWEKGPNYVKVTSPDISRDGN